MTPRYTLPEQGLVLLVDKPYGWTSFQVVNKVRYQLRRLTGIKKVKVGHAGTLDPLATGLLVLGLGKQTKSLNQWLADDKTYVASGCLGYTSPSYDLEQMPVKTPQRYEAIIERQLHNVLHRFTGTIDQYPPRFSAVKISGKRAYDLARAGKQVSLESRRIEIYSLRLIEFRYPHFTVEVHCSKGTYIRSLIHDIGTQLGTGAVLTALRRTRSGDHSIDRCTPENVWKTAMHKLLTPLAEA